MNLNIIKMNSLTKLFNMALRYSHTYLFNYLSYRNQIMVDGQKKNTKNSYKLFNYLEKIGKRCSNTLEQEQLHSQDLMLKNTLANTLNQ